MTVTYAENSQKTSGALELFQPYDVRVDASGRLWVADLAGDRVIRLAGLEAADRVISELGPDPAQVLTPTALAFDDASMFILDFASPCVFAIPAPAG